METYWTFIGNEIYDADLPTEAAAQEAADEWWAEQCDHGSGWRNGTAEETDIVLLNYYYNEETEERVEISRKSGKAYFEYYHGDYAEHNTMSRCYQ